MGNPQKGTCSTNGDTQDGLRCRGIDGADLDVQYVSSRGWRLGWHVGSWGTGNFTQQAQVLVTNLYLAVKNLPLTLRSQLRDYFVGRAQKFFQKSMGKRVSPVLRVAGGLLGLSCSRVWRIVAQVRGNFWEPVPPRQQSSTDITPAPTEAARADRVRLTLVRAALAVRTSSGPTYAFVAHLARLAVEGVDVGEKYHTKEFFSDVLFLSARCVQAYDAQDVYEKLRGTGIRSDFALLLDGVPVGGVSLHGRHGNVTVICICHVSPLTHRLHARLLTWFVPHEGHGGESLATGTANALAAQPFALSTHELRRSMCLVGGDGAVVRGGEDRAKPGTQAAEKLWRHVFPFVQSLPVGDDDLLVPAKDAWVGDPQHLHHCTEWDKFHKEDIAVNRAIGESPLAWELSAVVRLMDVLFHHGDGTLMLKTASQLAQDEVPRHGNLSGQARKVGTLAREADIVLHNFKSYAASMHLRHCLRDEGRDRHTKEGLIDTGRRLTSLDLVAFTSLFRDMARQVVEPWAKAIQSNALEPWVLQARHRRHTVVSKELLDVLFWSRAFLRVLVLLKQHAHEDDIKKLVGAAFFASPVTFFPVSAAGVSSCFGRRLPAYYLALKDFLTGSGPSFNGVTLQILPTSEANATKMCFGPHCMCSFFVGPRNAAQPRGSRQQP